MLPKCQTQSLLPPYLTYKWYVSRKKSPNDNFCGLCTHKIIIFFAFHTSINNVFVLLYFVKKVTSFVHFIALFRLLTYKRCKSRRNINFSYALIFLLKNNCKFCLEVSSLNFVLIFLAINLLIKSF